MFTLEKNKKYRSTLTQLLLTPVMNNWQNRRLMDAMEAMDAMDAMP